MPQGKTESIRIVQKVEYGYIVLVDLAELGRYHGIDDSAMLLDVCWTNCQILARV